MTSILESRVPLSRIQQMNDITQNLKRSIIISHKKLPKDFFPSKIPIKRELSIYNPRNAIVSQKMRRNFSECENNPSNFRRQAMTARQCRPEKDQDLIKSIISASYEIKRVIRKHSMQLRRSQDQVLNMSPQKSINRKMFKNLELPPLLLKKTMSLNQ